MLDSLIDALPLLMAAVLAVFLFAGFPVALTLAAVGFAFALLGNALDLFPWSRSSTCRSGCTPTSART